MTRPELTEPPAELRFRRKLAPSQSLRVFWHARDLLWAPARLETQEGESGSVFLPALYPDSHTHADHHDHVHGDVPVAETLSVPGRDARTIHGAHA